MVFETLRLYLSRAWAALRTQLSTYPSYMPDEWWELHYQTDDKIVHLADLANGSRAWCILRCDPDYQFEIAKGDVVLPVTCLVCLAR